MFKKKNFERYLPNAIINDTTPFAVTEAYKAARTSLMFMFDSDDCKKNSIVFTSYSPMEGKSTVALNLAVTFAQTGAKILVIDADMRKPAVDKYLDFTYDKGLSDILTNSNVDYKDCIIKTRYENLSVLPAGNIPANPTELLISNKTDELLTKLSPEYDYIFIDSPPLGLVTDAAIIGSKTEGIITIANCEKTKAADIKAIKTSLEQADIKLLGCIINSAEIEISQKKKYKNNYYYSGYGYGAKKEKVTVDKK